MSRSPQCQNERCIDGWIYNGSGGMVFPANVRCECNPPTRPTYTPAQLAHIAQIEASTAFFQAHADRTFIDLVNDYNITVEQLYAAFRTRMIEEMHESLKPQLKSLHDLAIQAYNSGGR